MGIGKLFEGFGAKKTDAGGNELPEVEKIEEVDPDKADELAENLRKAGDTVEDEKFE